MINWGKLTYLLLLDVTEWAERERLRPHHQRPSCSSVVAEDGSGRSAFGRMEKAVAIVIAILPVKELTGTIK